MTRRFAIDQDNSAFRIVGRTALALGLFQSLGPPDQSVSSFSASRSEPTPPKTIAPSRPLPIGRAWLSQFFAGWAYHSLSGAAARAEATASRTVDQNDPYDSIWLHITLPWMTPG